MTTSVTAIIVTHDSGDVLAKCLDSLGQQQNVSLTTVVVDSGSSDTTYLHDLSDTHDFLLIKEANIGFSRANNLGYQAAGTEADIVVFLNPDTYLCSGTLGDASSVLQKNPQVAIVTGILEGYDPLMGGPTGLFDSTGIFRKWYGRWYDRDQGCEARSNGFQTEKLPAICGAFMVCRQDALQELAPNIFDPDFFLYKEDIELSLRLRKKQWELLLEPKIRAYHCRGWKNDRKRIPLDLRIMSAKSEILLYRKHPSPYMVWAIVKYLLVRYLKA